MVPRFLSLRFFVQFTTTTTYSLIINHHFDWVSIALFLSFEVSGTAILLKPLDEAPVKVGKSNEHLDVSY